MRPFLPMTPEEAGGEVDIVLVTGDAYVDHPAWGVAAIGRWLEAHGYSVGILAQPDWTDVESFRALGRPRLFFGVTAGNMDTQVNKFTASRHLRSSDAYSPGGAVGNRPDRATIPYTASCRAAFKGVPVIAGGIEASLRRLVHYDYWQDRVRGSILLDAKADLLVYGMGERQILEIARRLDAGQDIKACRDIPGVAYALGAKDDLPEGDDVVTLPSLKECRQSGDAFNRVTLEMYRESNPHCGKTLVQPHGSRAVVCTPAGRTHRHEGLRPPAGAALRPRAAPLLPRARARPAEHPGQRHGQPGLLRRVLLLRAHDPPGQGRRLAESRERDARAPGDEGSPPGFNGIVSDLGGPTANMFHMHCTSEAANKVCRRVSCLHPVRCKHYGTDHTPYLNLLREARELPHIKRVYVNSGIRYDLAALDGDFVEELAKYHTPGQLSVAPEHASPTALKFMRKPEVKYFDAFMERFQEANDKANKAQFVVPYFQCAHPGIGPEETISLARYMKKAGLRPRQAQLFMPTPGTLSTAMYVTETDPYGGRPVYVAKGDRERSRQRALLFYWKREEWPHAREALRSWGRSDLIGRHADALIPPWPGLRRLGQAHQARLRAVRHPHGHEGRARQPRRRGGRVVGGRGRGPSAHGPASATPGGRGAGGRRRGGRRR